MDDKFLYIANWKMSLTLNESLNYLSSFYDPFVALAAHETTKLIIAPSTEGLFPIAQVIKDSGIELAGQCCASHERGSLTGQTSALSLRELGCTYCIAGHSERRRLAGETDTAVAKQVSCLLSNDIIPIACVGEDDAAYQNKTTLNSLENQLSPIVEVVQQSSNKRTPLCIAYEPHWAIGADKAANNDHIDSVLAWISTYLEKSSLGRPYRLIYGGSVTSQNGARLKEIKHISGFLIGRASLDFQELEKIVHYN